VDVDVNVYEKGFKKTRKSLLFALTIFLTGVVARPLTVYVIMEMDVMQSMFGPLLFAPFVIPFMVLPLALMLGAVVWTFFILLKTRREIASIDAKQAEYVPTPEFNSLKEKNNKMLTVLFGVFVLIFLFSFFVGFLEQTGS
jgi:hypothetical protein